MRPLLQCGHAASAVNKDGHAVCAICIGIKPGADEVIEVSNLVLESRTAICHYCGKEAPSSSDLPFFSYQKNMKVDDFYCGCRGWD